MAREVLVSYPYRLDGGREVATGKDRAAHLNERFVAGGGDIETFTGLLGRSPPSYQRKGPREESGIARAELQYRIADSE